MYGSDSTSNPCIAYFQSNHNQNETNAGIPQEVYDLNQKENILL